MRTDCFVKFVHRRSRESLDLSRLAWCRVISWSALPFAAMYSSCPASDGCCLVGSCASRVASSGRLPFFTCPLLSRNCACTNSPVKAPPLLWLLPPFVLHPSLVPSLPAFHVLIRPYIHPRVFEGADSRLSFDLFPPPGFGYLDIHHRPSWLLWKISNTRFSPGFFLVGHSLQARCRLPVYLLLHCR